MQRVPPDTVQFPDKPLLSTAKFQGRHFPGQALLAEPSFVNYNRLYFNEINAERYGWDLGVIQPAVSTLYFIKDFVTLPYHVATRPCHRFESSAGKCMPGDPVPYIIYPPEISVPGTILEGAAVVALFAIFP